MRFARLPGLCLAVMLVALLAAPAAAAEPPFRLPGYVTDQAGVLTSSDRAAVESAVDNLYNDRELRLWVVFVQTFSGQDAVSWTTATIGISDLQSTDAVLAVATGDRAYALQVPASAGNLSSSEVDSVRRTDIEPALRRDDWAGAAVAAADGLNRASAPGGASLPAFLFAMGVIALALIGLLIFNRRRRRQRRKAAFAAARRMDPTDPRALSAVSLDALDELSRAKVVEVDNALRTSEHELELAIDEFGEHQTQPFTRAVDNAKRTLAQAFNVRQQLDDAIPETPAQRRDLLTRVVVAAARADRELDAQTEAFEKLRSLVINAPAKLDAMTQQLVAITSRIGPAEQQLTALHTEFNESALVSVAGNVDTARERLAFAEQNITRARELADRPVAGQQSELVDSVRAAQSALGQARSLVDAVDSAASDIRRAAAGLAAAITDIEAGINQADTQLREGNLPKAGDLAAARRAAATAVANAQATGSADPLGAFTQLTKADADLDRLLVEVEQQREAAERLARTFEQALFTAQSRVRAVSDYIDTRRGSIGPEARTRLAEAARQLEAATAKRATDVAEAIAHANGAAALAAQAQTMANKDVRTAQRAYSGRYRGHRGGSNMGAMIGGLVIGNILSGAMRGGGFGGGFGGGGGWHSTGFGGSGGGGGGFMGGGGRF